MDKYKMKKADLIVFLVLLLLAIGGYYISQLTISGNGEQVVIKQDGKVYGEYPLSRNREIIIDNNFGRNEIVIRDNQVYVLSANCRDKFCVKHKPISMNNENIICLPHKLVIEVQKKDEKKEGVDSIAN